MQLPFKACLSTHFKRDSNDSSIQKLDKDFLQSSQIPIPRGTMFVCVCACSTYTMNQKCLRWDLDRNWVTLFWTLNACRLVECTARLMRLFLNIKFTFARRRNHTCYGGKRGEITRASEISSLPAEQQLPALCRGRGPCATNAEGRRDSHRSKLGANSSSFEALWSQRKGRERRKRGE